MKIAVTGSGGYIGSFLIPSLENRGHEVHPISRRNGFDLSNWDSIKDIPKIDLVIHLAARTFVPDSFANPREFYLDNTTFTINALELARKWKSKFIYMSSYFYGPPQYIPVDENHPLAPHNPYAQTKWLSEELCKAYSRDFDIRVIAFRLFNLYGPGQTGSLLIPEILEKIKHQKEITLKDPRPKRDYIHIEDVVSAIIAGLDYKEAGFEMFNLGTGVSISVEEIVTLIQKYSNEKFNVTYTHEYRKGEVLDSIANIEKIRKKLSWSPEISFEAGIKKII